MPFALNNNYLYAVSKIEVVSSNGKKNITSSGTGFFIDRLDPTFGH